jgi:hypothetical protein
MASLTSTRRRIVAAALLIPIVLALAPNGAQANPALGSSSRTVSERICDFDWRTGTRQVKQLIKCAVARWNSPGGAKKALSVARCESGFDPDAYNSGGYAGVYQHATRYWPDRADHWGFPDRSAFNGRANVIVSIRMAHASGWGAWGCA